MKKTVIALLALIPLTQAAELVVDLRLDGNFTDSNGNLTFTDNDARYNNPDNWLTSIAVGGSTKYVSVGGNAGVWGGSFTTKPSDNYAVSFFVNVGELPVFNNEAGKQEGWVSSWIIGGGTTNTDEDLKIGIGTTGEVKVDVKNRFSTSSGNYTLDLGKWYQVGLSVTTSSENTNNYDYTIFINGESVSTITKANAVDWSNFALFEGADYTQNGKRFVGLVDDIQIYNVSNLEDASNVMSNQAARLVPEPTTATLSLLALAGLAARRRRK